MQKVVTKKPKSSEANHSDGKVEASQDKKGSKSKSWEMSANEALRVNYLDHEISSQA